MQACEGNSSGLMSCDLSSFLCRRQQVLKFYRSAAYAMLPDSHKALVAQLEQSWAAAAAVVQNKDYKHTLSTAIKLH